jgi:PiT family inorganic phosphate transporter
VVVTAGADHVVWGWADLAAGELHGVMKVLISLLVSPLAGFAVGFLVHRVVRRRLNRARPVANRYLRIGQAFTSAGLAFSHGTNDAQKSMGILTVVLLLGGFLPEFAVPSWVVLAAASAITAGTLLGGWRIAKTLGFAIYKLRPLHAFDAQLSSAGVILGASLFGAPVSTTHVVSTSIMGVGSADRPRAVRWEKAREIAITWVVTIPGAALMAMAVTYLAVALTPLSL